MVQQPLILIVEDEPAIRAMIATALSMSNYDVIEAESGPQAFEAMYHQKPDLMLLDWMLPSMSGIEILRRMKREEYAENIPVIMLTAKTTEENLLQGLKTGADDYIAKPFSPRELLARIEAVLRRSRKAKDNTFVFDDLCLNHSEHSVSIGENQLELGPTEYKLLHFFMLSPNRAYTRSQLLDHVWGGDAYIEERTVDVHITRLRKALQNKSTDKQNYGACIETVRGTGYRFATKKSDRAE